MIIATMKMPWKLPVCYWKNLSSLLAEYYCSIHQHWYNSLGSQLILLNRTHLRLSMSPGYHGCAHFCRKVSGVGGVGGVGVALPKKLSMPSSRVVGRERLGSPPQQPPGGRRPPRQSRCKLLVDVDDGAGRTASAPHECCRTPTDSGWPARRPRSRSFRLDRDFLVVHCRDRRPCCPETQGGLEVSNTSSSRRVGVVHTCRLSPLLFSAPFTVVWRRGLSQSLVFCRFFLFNASVRNCRHTQNRGLLLQNRTHSLHHEYHDCMTVTCDVASYQSWKKMLSATSSSTTHNINGLVTKQHARSKGRLQEYTRSIRLIQNFKDPEYYSGWRSTQRQGCNKD